MDRAAQSVRTMFTVGSGREAGAGTNE